MLITPYDYRGLSFFHWVLGMIGVFVSYVVFRYILLKPLLRILLILILRKSENGRNLCPQCGYDIRQCPGRSPECGTEVDDWRPIRKGTEHARQ